MDFQVTLFSGIDTNSVGIDLVHKRGVVLTVVDNENYIRGQQTDVQLNGRVCMLPGDKVYLRVVWHSNVNPVNCLQCFSPPPPSTPPPPVISYECTPGAGYEPWIKPTAGDIILQIQPVVVADGLSASSALLERCIGSTVELCKTIDPSLTIRDVLEGVSHARGLLWITDFINKTVTPIPSSNFFTAFDTVDLTSKLVTDKPFTKFSEYDKCINYKFNYKKAEDWFTNYWDNLYYNSEGLYSRTDILDSSNPCILNSENPTFATCYSFPINSIFIELEQAAIPPFKALWLALRKDEYIQPFPFVHQPEAISYDFMPRLAKYAGFLDAAGLGWTQSQVKWKYQLANGTNYVYSAFPYSYVVDYYQLTRPSLSYADVTRRTVSPTQVGGAIETSEGIITTYYDPLYEISKKGIKYEATFLFSPKDIKTLSFSRYVKLTVPDLGTGLFYLAEVKQWTPSDGLAKCVLLHLPDGYPIS